MKENKFNEIKGFLPLTIQNANVNAVKSIERLKGVKAKSYQSNNVNCQQFYKPISKTLSF